MQNKLLFFFFRMLTLDPIAFFFSNINAEILFQLFW